MQYNNQAYLSLVWKDPKERKQYLLKENVEPGPGDRSFSF